MTPLDRRSFLRTLTLGAAAAPVVAAPLNATPRSTGPVWKKTPCPLCTAGCGLLVGIQNGRAVAVKGDPESPVSRGLACVKGYHSIQALYARDRITKARVRRNGALVEAPLGEALDVVAAQLRRTIEQHGRDSVAVYGAAGWNLTDAYVAAKLFRGGVGTSNVESAARLHAASATAGLASSFGLEGPLGCLDDIEHADVFVLWNHNMAETDPVLFSRILQRRRTNPGVQIVDVSSRTSRTSYAADRSLLFAPGTELALANALSQEIVARRWQNRQFVERHVAFRKGRTQPGYMLGDGAPADDDVADATFDEYVRFLAAYTPDRAERIAGTPAEDIRWLASLYGDRTRRVMTLWGAQVNQHVRGTWVNNALYNLHLLVGKIGTPGNTALCTAGQPGGTDASAPAENRALVAQVWNVAGERVAAASGPTPLPLFRAVERGAVRFLWVQSADPLVDLPNLERFRAAARRANCFLVVSDTHPTVTTDAADVVLPAALWLEREGILGSADRRAQHFERLLDAPGDATPDAWLMIEVARRLGMGALFPWERAQVTAAAWEEYGRFRNDPRRRAPAMQELRTHAGAMWPLVDGHETMRRCSAEDPAVTKGAAFDFYGHPDHRAWIWLRPHEPRAEQPDRAYPFWLTQGPVLEHSGTGTLTRRIPTLHRAVPRAYAELNADDARALNVRNGDIVRLVSRRGALEVEARIDHRSQPPRGQVFMPSFDEGVPVNVLTLDAACPLSGQPDYTCAVRIERVRGRGT